DAVTQIPEWAHYYSIVRSKNLTTDFFFQGHATDVLYVTKDADNKLVFDPNNFVYNANHYGIGIKITSLIGYGIGYTFTEGDRINLYPGYSSNVYELNVIGQYSDWVITSLENIGGVATPQMLFEIYTPRKQSMNEGFYEVGETYSVLNPGATTRTFSKLTGTLNGDVYGISRQSSLFSYVAEAMSPNDKFWKNWHSDLGWFSIVDKIGQRRRPNSIAWSNVYIPGTRTNGLSSFDVLDVDDVPVENGSVQSLQLTSKTQEEGSVLLAICKNETASIYLGETQVFDTAGNAFTAISNRVIGTINPLKGSLGTSHPESVQQFNGNVYWFDVYSGAVCQYSSNGLFPASNYKMKRFVNKYCKRYLATSNTRQVIGAIDPYNNEYLLTMPSVEATGFPGALPSMSKINEFDIYDGQRKTIAFKFGMDKFLTAYSFAPEHFEYLGNQLYAFVAGAIWKHNDTVITDNNFYGIQYLTKIMFIGNSLPQKVKAVSNISIEGNMAPEYSVFYTDLPNEQITDLVSSEFRAKEGIYYASILRDRLSPNVAGTPEAKLISGDKMRTAAIKCQIEFNTSAKKLQLKFVNIGYHISEGHST
ncbi:MAG: hypothetical protein WKF91_23270, partial [Segetibacter sp.]